MRGHGKETPEFLERCAPLTRELGSDPGAVRIARAVVRRMDITTLEELRAYYSEVGPVAFGQEIRDLPYVGIAMTQRILAAVAPRKE